MGKNHARKKKGFPTGGEKEGQVQKINNLVTSSALQSRREQGVVNSTKSGGGKHQKNGPGHGHGLI